MKWFLICLLLFIGFSCSAAPDTIDNWHVYYNSKEIARFIPETKPHHQVIIKKSTVNTADNLTVRYMTDTPDDNAITSLYIIGNTNSKVLLAHNKGIGNPLIVPFRELLRLAALYHTNKLNFYYRDNRRDNLIFTLLFK